MMDLITEHIATWTAAEIPKANGGRGRGRGANGQSPHGIKKLRELILELAVRGKLVEQDPNDEPANVLLEKIAKEKARLVKEGTIKKEKPLPEINADEKPFELPDGWEWARLGEVGDTNIGLTYSPKNISDNGVPVLRSSNIQQGKLDYSDLIRVDVVVPERSLVCEGDLLICARNGSRALVGKVAIIDTLHEKTAFGAFMAIFRSRLNEYFYHFITSPLFRSVIDEVNTTTINQITQNNLRSSMAPIPPLAEQHRIVAKVDELMALCDKLEQQQTDSNETHQTLVETLLATLTTSTDPDEFALSWQRIAAHFDTLFTTEKSIDQLKQTILQLAVMGKLVPQDPNDEPANVLLEKIAKEKACLIKEGKIKKQKPLPKIGEDEKLFALPDGWVWIKFGLLAEFINGDRSKNYPNRSEYVEEGVPWINTGHIEPNGFLTSTDMNFISREKFESLRSGKIEKGDLVYCLRGATFGKTAFVEPYEEGAIASSLMIIRPHITGLNQYIYKYLVSPFGKAQLFRFDNGSAQPNLSANSVLQYAFPLPPLTEQHRIVAKVDELMAFCDTLKERLRDCQITQIQLADAIVEKAVA